jgi:predicted transcriptional regulator of viral defense system
VNQKAKALIEIAKRSGDWECCLASFSSQHQGVLKATGNKVVTSAEVADRLMEPRRSLQSAISRLCVNGVLHRRKRGKYAVADKDFAAYLELCVIDLNKDEVSIEAEKIAYRAMAPFFEALEHQGLIVGNGHHIAQKIAGIAKDMVDKQWRDQR